MKIADRSNYSLMQQIIETNNAPKAIGPYSQAVRSGPFLFVSGQLPIDPKTGTIASSTIEGQTGQVLANLEAILVAAGLSLADVVKTDVFLKNMHDFPAMNAVYAKAFNGPLKPARATIQAAMLPMDALVEISCIASLK